MRDKFEDSVPWVQRVLVATDRSESADMAVCWAAAFAAGFQAKLLVLQVLVPEDSAEPEADIAEATRIQANQALNRFAEELAGDRGSAAVVVDSDPVHAILETIEREAADVVVVGNVGMAGRKKFLLGNVPNRISHNAGCTVIIVNTASMNGKANVSGITVRTLREGHDSAAQERLLGRATFIGRVLVKAGVRELLKRSQPDDEAQARFRARRLCAALDELGPTFGKLGQVLSTRPDLLPPPYLEELATLQERVTPLTEAEVVAVMEQELGVPWEDVFAGIDPEPLAAGTIAQVHRATLETGERVVVKVQRPTAERNIMLDLALLELFAEKAATRPSFKRVFDIPGIIGQLSDSLRRELDFRQEAANIHRMSQVLSPFPRLAVPRVYEEYSTSRLLVMEEVQGVPVREAPQGAARQEAARQLLESYYSQVMIEGFFHADPHPGNMKWWNDRIYFLDLGMVGEVEPDIRRLMLLLMLAFSQRDSQLLSEVILKLAGEDQRQDLFDFEAFQAEVGRLVEKYRDLSLREIQFGPMLQEIARISARHQVRVSASLTLAGKAFTQMQLAVAELDPTLDPFSVAGSFILKNTVQRVMEGLDPKKLFYVAQKAGFRLEQLLESIEGLTGARPGNRLQVNFQITERLEEAIKRAARRLSLALGISAVFVATAVTALSAQIPSPLPIAMGSLGGVLAVILIADYLRR